MNFHPSLLLSLLLAPLSSAAPQQVMYIGDSLTHGYSSSSYRWHLHKMLVDSGLEYSELGIKQGNTGRNQLKAGSSYRGVTFQNIHSAQSSARAWEIAGYKAGPRFGGSKLDNWLGLDSETAAGKPYRGASFTADQTPDLFVMMIGSNDLLSDNEREPRGLPAVAARESKELLSHVSAIYTTMRKANPKAQIYLTTVPSWGDHRSLNLQDWRRAVHTYNKALTTWAKGKKNLTLININQGLIAEGLKAHPDFFIADGLHFNEQGNLLIAGNIAQAMRLSGRSVGLERREAKHIDTPHEGDGISISLRVDGTGRYGIGNGTRQASIDVSHRLITWKSHAGSKVLYAGNLGKIKQRLRIAWVKGDAQQGIEQGYYVWLGTRLIGDALPSDAINQLKGCFPNKESKGAPLIDQSGSYAPALSQSVKQPS